MEMMKNGNGRMSLRGNMGSNSISNMQQCQFNQYQQHQFNPNVAPQYQMWQPQFQQVNFYLLQKHLSDFGEIMGSGGFPVGTSHVIG